MNRRLLLVAVPVAVAAAAASVAIPASAASSSGAGSHIRSHIQPRHSGASAASPAAAGTARSHDAASLRAAESAVPAVVPHAPITVSGPSVVYGDLSPVFGRSIISRDLDTQGLTLLVPWSTSNCPDQPKLSPDGSKLAYLLATNDPDCSGTVPSHLVVKDLTTGTVVTDLAPATNHFFDLPNWGASNANVLYTDGVLDAQHNFVDSGLLTVAVGTTTTTPVGGAAQHAYDGVLSPNGARIVFAQTNPLTSQFLAVMDSNGSNVSNLPATGSHTGQQFSADLPSWSPDGNKISYQYDKPDWGNAQTHNIAVINADGSGDTTFAITKQNGWTGYFSTWSPDSTEVLFDHRLVDPTTGAATTNTRISATTPAGTRLATVVASSTDVVYSPTFLPPGPPSSAASTFTPIAPTRVRTQITIGQGSIYDVGVAGVAGVPANATAVTLNLTGVKASAATYLQVFPAPASGTAFPKVSNLNLNKGETYAVAVQATVGSGGKVRVRNNVGSVGFIVDVTGYFAAGTGDAGYTPITPFRAYDGSLGPDGQHEITVTAGGSGVPAGAVAVVVNLTANNPTVTTYQSMLPSPATTSALQQVSTLNLPHGTTRANLATVPVGAGNKITVYNHQGTARTIVDIEGYYSTSGGADLAYHPLQPTRILDTRYGTNTLLGLTTPLGKGGTLDLPILGTTTNDSGIVRVPANLSPAAAVVNVTAVGATGSTFVAVYPSPGSGIPTTSTLNPTKGQTVPNLTITGTGAGGSIRMYNNAGSVSLIGDLAGYYG